MPKDGICRVKQQGITNHERQVLAGEPPAWPCCKSATIHGMVEEVVRQFAPQGECVEIQVSPMR